MSAGEIYASFWAMGVVGDIENMDVIFACPGVSLRRELVAEETMLEKEESMELGDMGL